MEQWIEKYRPKKLDDVILQRESKVLIKTIIETGNNTI